MTDGNDGEPNLEEAVDRFLDGATAVYGEYEQGYMDADSALTVLERHVERLRTVAADRAAAEPSESVDDGDG